MLRINSRVVKEEKVVDQVYRLLASLEEVSVNCIMKLLDLFMRVEVALVRP